MTSRSIPIVLLAAALALACGSTGSGGGAAGDGGSSGGGSGGAGGSGDLPEGDWPQFRRDLAGTSAAPGVFGATDAARLAAGFSVDLEHAVYGQAVAAGGTAYLPTADVGTVTALDLATGARRWTVTLDAPTHADCDGRDRHPGIWGAPAIVGGTLYTAAPDGALYALRPDDGAVLWKVQVAAPTPDGELLASSVIVSTALGKAYVGVASTAHCDQIAGRLVAVDLATRTATARTLVGADQRGGSVWAAVAVDEGAGLVFAATGNAVGDAAAEPLAQAIVALDARTLEPKDHWQNANGLQDGDFGGAPLLFDAGARKLVAATSKDGVLYVLDRTRLADGPVWTHRLAVLDPAQPGEGGDPLTGFGSMAAPALANGLLYVGGGRTPEGAPGAIYAFDPATGAVRFVHETPGAVLQPVVAVGEVLLATSLIPSGGSALEVLDARTGAGLARFDDGAWSLAPATWASGRILWPDASGNVRTYTLPR